MKQATLPNWLQQTQPVALPSARHHWSGRDYLEKTLHHINKIIAEDARSAVINEYQGLWQGLATDSKLLGIAALLLAASLTKSLVFLMALNSIVFCAAIQSGIGCKAFGIRVWLPAFVFVGLAVLPGVISWITPGEPLYTFYSGVEWRWGFITLPTELSITKQGLLAACFVVLRAAASLGLATLFIKTTRWSLVTRTLAKFGLPAGIVTVFDLTYRYIYLFLQLLTDFLLGRRSRLVGAESEAAKISWIGGTIAAFMNLTWEYSQEINFAMQSRGYYGQHYSIARVHLRGIDRVFLVLVAILCCCALWRNF